MDSKKEAPFILAVRLRGAVGYNSDVEKTMRSLMLDRKFTARLFENSPSNVGMLQKTQTILAWGEPNEAALEALLRKRAEVRGRRGMNERFAKEQFQMEGVKELANSIASGELRLDTLWSGGVKQTFRLHPPKGGFKRSTRRTRSDGGELGYRGLEINTLVLRMV